MPEFVIAERLFGSDLRMLACRVYPDPAQLVCLKVPVHCNDTVYYLCQRRVEAFLADAPSLAGITCVDRLEDDR